MEYIPGPRSLSEHPDRFLNCQEAIADAFRQLAEQEVMAGWGEIEVAGALADISDFHLLSLASNLETERMIEQAIKERREIMSDRYPDTLDGRYFVVRGRLWRKSDPALDEATRNRLVTDLMSARRAVRGAKGDPDAIAKARHLVDDAKVALGERGAPWWEDGAPDYNRHMAKNTPYAEWFANRGK
ncbi:hypothetical protein FHT80_006345 [Rhizobium sp. BK226]|uniref:hypothetical protein n=1 Tax=Rhizobium sp. BK226 TaxID=2587075 RepID=UPI001833066A|nr:hypothetical protein [Rhizobium sp. BK226]MBB4116964.1 hypothetical protein [Rhizobium sp. BK226]